MASAIQYMFSYLFALLAQLFRPFLQDQLEHLSRRLLGDIPQLHGPWVVYFANPCSGRRFRLGAVDAHLRQFGCHVRGFGHVQGQPGDLFEYRGVIKRNVFYGTFRRRKTHILAGTGTFVLKISSDSEHLTGQCTWYDRELDDIWSSAYVWESKGD